MKWGAQNDRHVGGKKKVIHLDTWKWIFGPVWASEWCLKVEIWSISKSVKRLVNYCEINLLIVGSILRLVDYVFLFVK